ncbi:MAG: arabinogalactan endo-1,4-beta-galactosidase [Treponema sp.]|nr:arabinogalactan endo-1,4-beta-galactosidase [Treponema sp.]
MKKIFTRFIISLSIFTSCNICFAKDAVQYYSIGENTISIKALGIKTKKDFIKGFDASAINDEFQKDKYKDDNGNKKDVLEILKNHGVNWVRFRIWNNPKDENNPDFPGNSNLETVIQQCKKAKELNLKILLDFHYSDYWADPGKQAIPHDWLQKATADTIAENLYNWTAKVVKALKEANCSPDMIQIGNEINSGILTGYYENGKLQKLADELSGSSQPQRKNPLAKANYTKYLAAGIKAVREYSPSSKIMLHVANGGANISWLLDIYKNAGLDYDVIGLSYYPFERSHGKIEQLAKNIKTFRKKYKKEVVIAETAHPWKTDNPTCKDLENASNNLTNENGKVYENTISENGYITASLQNQVNVIRAIMKIAAENGALGVFTWGGEYIGNWKYAFFDENGLPLPSLYIFSLASN